MMPAIKAHAKIAFRHLGPEAREEAVQETLCNACCAFARLVEFGKTDLASRHEPEQWQQANQGRARGHLPTDL